MSQDRPNAVHIGYGKDSLGFRCAVLEDTLTHARYLAYEPETWWERCRYISQLAALNKRVPETNPDTTPVEVSNGRVKASR